MRALRSTPGMGWVLGLVVCATAAPLAGAGPVVRNLGGGWQATIIQPDISDMVGVGFDPNSRTLTVEKTARFEDIDPDTLQPSPINILFTQIAADANTANKIAITRETITNATGVAWDRFKMILIDAGQVAFNQPLSAGFSITPFTSRSYNGTSTQVDFFGGIVPNGGQWFPGQTAGELVIDVNLASTSPVNFTLKELPVPEPTTALGMLLASAALMRRRMS